MSLERERVVLGRWVGPPSVESTDGSFVATSVSVGGGPGQPLLSAVSEMSGDRLEGLASVPCRLPSP